MADQWAQNNESIVHVTNQRGCQCHSRCPHTCTAYYWSHWYGLYVRSKLVGKSLCIFVVSTRTNDMPTCLWAPHKSMRNSKLTFPVCLDPCPLVQRPSLPCWSSTKTSGVYSQKDGCAILRWFDYIIYSVEAEFIERVVGQYGHCEYRSRRGFKCQLTWMLATKVNAIVSGQTSVEVPENFEAHLPIDVYPISCHSSHGPTVSPVEQLLVLCTSLCSAQELIDLLRSHST